MQLTKTITPLIISPGILMACNSNQSTSGLTADPTSKVSALLGSGNDMYYEYSLTTTGENNSISGTTKMYISSKGDLRSEMNNSMDFSGKKSSIVIVSIGHLDKPNESIIIDDSAKTYSINHIDTAGLHAADGSNTKYSVSKIGEETIAGFNCMHARIIANKAYNGVASFMNSIDTTDLWLSSNVPVPAQAKKYMEKLTGKISDALFNADVANQLKQMGCEGFVVKMMIHDKTSSTMEELVKVEHRDLPACLFEIPAGYKEDKSGM